MSVRSKEEIITQITERFSGDTSDDVITLIEDVTDTLNALNGSDGDGKDWKAEAERIDKEWREKYISRFKSGSDSDDDNNDSKGGEIKTYTYENLFK